MFERHQRQLRHDKRTVPAVKLCTVCGVVTSRAGSRCTEHARQSNRSRHNALYSTPAWQRLSARVLRVWRGERGNWCPGYQRLAHRAADLTVDHVVPLAAGGAPFDIGNTAVLCRSCNSTKGASTDRGGVALMAAPMRPDRDAIHEIALDAAVIVPPMRTLLESGEFVGTATDLLDRLAAIAGETATRRKGWPGNATSLSRELARIAPNLRSTGIEVEKRRESHGRRLIAIRSVPETPSPASPPSLAPDVGDAASPDGDATEASDEAGVTDHRARGDTGDAGDGLLPPPSSADLDVAREALRIFADDLTDESAARLNAIVDGADGFDWGGLA